MKLIKLLILVFVLNLNFVQAAEVDYAQQVKMFEACADDKFKNYYSSSYYEDFIKTSLKKDFQSSLKSNGFWLSTILNAVKYDQNIERVSYLNTIVDSITLNEIAKLAEKFFDDKYLEDVSFISE